LLLGAIAVALALAVGLGGRDIAARELDEVVQSIKAKKTITWSVSGGLSAKHSARKLSTSNPNRRGINLI